MNKRKRVATLKHRRRQIKYERPRKEALRKGIPLAEVAHRQPARPRTVVVPLQEAVMATAAVEAAAPARRTRRAAAQEKPAVAAPAQRTRRATAAEPAAEAKAPARRTQRAGGACR